jgi:Family of unknown function (DUF6481)
VSGFRDDSVVNRLNTAGNAKKALLERAARARAEADSLAAVERRAARAAVK